MSEETKHTKLPWFQSGTTIQTEDRFIALVGAHPRTEEDIANAEFIFRACNNYEAQEAKITALLDACKEILKLNGTRLDSDLRIAAEAAIALAERKS